MCNHYEGLQELAKPLPRSVLMAHRLSPEAESQLDGIWLHVAIESGSVESADRIIDTMCPASIPARAGNGALGGGQSKPCNRSAADFSSPGHLIAVQSQISALRDALQPFRR